MRFTVIIVAVTYFIISFIDDRYSERNEAIVDSAVEISKSSFLRGCTEAGESLSWCLIKMKQTENDTRELLNSEIIRKPADIKKEETEETQEKNSYSDPIGKQKRA